MAKRKTCAVCSRKPGCTKNLCGEEDGTPLGALEKCDACGLVACPDCLHEADCCFRDADDHAKEPDWAPPGWRVSARLGGITEYSRV